MSNDHVSPTVLDSILPVLKIMENNQQKHAQVRRIVNQILDLKHQVNKLPWYNRSDRAPSCEARTMSDDRLDHLLQEIHYHLTNVELAVNIFAPRQENTQIEDYLNKLEGDKNATRRKKQS